MTTLRNRSMRAACGVAAGLACFAALSSPASAKMYGLVIGINSYQVMTPLKGAVADAEDIAAALKGAGGEVTKLIDAEATRDRIEAEWKWIVDRAGPGDTFVFAYAGHGGQEPHSHPDPDLDGDGKDETFLLAPFNPNRSNPNFKERIVDKDFARWLKAAAGKGIKIVVVADSCHSGGMTRSINPALPTRAAPPYGEEPGLTFESAHKKAQEALATAPKQSGSSDGGIQGVSFLLAVTKDKLAPEVLIDGKARGALSYAFAKAIRNGANATEGAISPLDVQVFANEQIVQRSEGLQVPDFRPLKLTDERILPTRSVTANAAVQPGKTGAGAADAVRGLTDLAGRQMITLAVTGGGSTAGITGITEVRDIADATLVWDAATREVRSNVGDVVAENITREGLQAVVDKWRLLPVLKDMMANRAVSFSLSQGFRSYTLGEQFRLSSTAPKAGRYMMVLDLGPDGGVSILEPGNDVRRNPAIEKLWPAWSNYTLDIKVTPDTGYGADHILLISSSQPMMAVYTHRNLKASDLPALLEVALSGATFEMGLAGIYTRAK